MKIVSLIPSATEIVAALGFERQLVGRSHECDFPHGIERLPALTAPKFPADGTSYEIDARVKALVQEGLSVYRVDAELLRELRPDVIVTQSQCDVCAASLADVEAAVSEWRGGETKVVSLAPSRLADVFSDVRRVAAALGAEDEGRRLVDRLQLRMTLVAKRARALRARPTVVTIEWLDPLMAAGNWMPELVEHAGGRSALGKPGEHSPWVEWDEVRRADPEIVVVLPCGFDVPRALEEISLLEARPGWRELRAVRNGRVFVVDGNQYFNRPGPRLADSLEILAETFHPDEFHFGHEGNGWVRYADGESA